MKKSTCSQARKNKYQYYLSPYNLQNILRGNSMSVGWMKSGICIFVNVEFVVE